MADFNQAVQKTLINEGGYVNNPLDRGGPTKYGVTQADMPGVDIETITTAQAAEYFRENYWKDFYSQISSQAVAEKLFDMGVLFGVKTAVRLLQSALANAFPVDVDGDFGPETLGALEQADEDSLLSVYKQNLVAYTLKIVANNPEQRVFVAGWGKRINS
jgi:lysozyme family protein